MGSLRRFHTRPYGDEIPRPDKVVTPPLRKGGN